MYIIKVFTQHSDNFEYRSKPSLNQFLYHLRSEFRDGLSNYYVYASSSSSTSVFTTCNLQPRIYVTICCVHSNASHSARARENYPLVHVSHA